MIRSRIKLYFLFLAPVLFLGLSWDLWGLESPEGANTENSENALSRLIEISDQLSKLNEKLRTELQDSRQNSRQLQTMLETSKRELDVFRLELETLRSSSAELSTKAENSRTELTALETALRKAGSSLTSLELSFTAYRETAEKKIKSLEKEKRLWKWGCVAAGVLAAGFGGTLLITGQN